jgi:hypothetical protein
MNIITLHDGAPGGPASLYATPRVAAPSAPVNVTVTPVSHTEVGVRWNMSAFDGGAAVTKVRPSLCIVCS